MIIEKMEDRDSSLEETFANYELGMKMVKSCSDQIDRVEKKDTGIGGGKPGWRILTRF